MHHKTILASLIILAGAGLLSLDLFLHPGEPATFDGPIHITNIAMFQKALTDGDFPVVWADGFANYGLPIPLVSQQIPAYLGALLSLVIHNPVLAFKLLLLLSSVIGGLAMYAFLSLYVTSNSATLGSILYLFTAYRITNLYIRGALPELLASALIPLLLLGINKLLSGKPHGFIWVTLITALLIATHPFIFIISLFMVIPYITYLITLRAKNRLKKIPLLGLAFICALGLDSWYLFPLLLEMKYFVISRNVTQFVFDQFATLSTYLVTKWPYFLKDDVFVRGNRIQFGLMESLILLTGLPFLILKSKKYKYLISWFILPVSLLITFMTLKLAAPLYRFIPYLDGIQFPWRMFSALIILPPLVMALVLDRLPRSPRLNLLILILILSLRIPPAYGKNFILYPQSHYTHTLKNLHFDSLNTIWIGNTTTYPERSQKGAIIEGEGNLATLLNVNSRRLYDLNAVSPVRLADYTFYFPGWHVYIDGKPTEIEFQDVNYRGIITYWVPAGHHQIKVILEPTKVRLAGQYLSLLSLAFVFGLIFMKRKISWLN